MNACDRPRQMWYRVTWSSLGTLLTCLFAQMPVAAQATAQPHSPNVLSSATIRQTSLHTLRDESPPGYPITRLPFRVRAAYVPRLKISPAFPDPILPEPVYPLRLVIRLGERRVYVYRGDTVEVSYPVAVGRQGWETPTGEYEVLNMIEHPEWRNPFTGEVIGAGSSNPLGERWIGFWTDGENYIGFHGTPNEASVGTAASHGCVRMYNHHVRELFQIVALGTPVTVEP